MQAAFSSLQSRNEIGPFICKYIYTYMHILQRNFMMYIHGVCVRTGYAPDASPGPLGPFQLEQNPYKSQGRARARHVGDLNK